ncbi:hypothetical protein NKW85_03115 [Staphylococcus simulans]|uniref:hypothetical protein n=1 Tax=Staphylococcus simulans TaxID=1286 RepID=UPI0009DD5895|nr:hypothetical protein [Staphylococcus simulans]PTJ34722.1 hypothetical protein BU026_01750 [Staphylococcus simulans]UXR48181.1 hypothetical protein MUA57_03170 [Staphylococcus simulans]
MLLLFFLAGPLIIGVGNLILAPIFNRRVPMNVRFRAFMIGSMIYLISAYLVYKFVLKGQL